MGVFFVSRDLTKLSTFKIRQTIKANWLAEQLQFEVLEL